jgi:hypothetical protein
MWARCIHAPREWMVIMAEYEVRLWGNGHSSMGNVGCHTSHSCKTVMQDWWGAACGEMTARVASWAGMETGSSGYTILLAAYGRTFKHQGTFRNPLALGRPRPNSRASFSSLLSCTARTGHGWFKVITRAAGVNESCKYPARWAIRISGGNDQGVDIKLQVEAAFLASMQRYGVDLQGTWDMEPRVIFRRS